jgi:hypothetical protein
MAKMRHAGRSSSRDKFTQESRAWILVEHGNTTEFGPWQQPGNNLRTGGTYMKAVLGPDQATNSMSSSRRIGSPTKSLNSLHPLIPELNKYQNNGWIAGHLLNAELGGSGTEDENLTPLTTAANGAHKFYEKHIKNMLELCHRLDTLGKDAKDDPLHWYGVHYEVTVSPDSFFNPKTSTEIYSYCPSHITLEHRFITLPKSDYAGRTFNEVKSSDRNFTALRTEMANSINNKGAGTVVQNFSLNGGDRVSVEIHNTD